MADGERMFARGSCQQYVTHGDVYQKMRREMVDGRMSNVWRPVGRKRMKRRIGMENFLFFFPLLLFCLSSSSLQRAFDSWYKDGTRMVRLWRMRPRKEGNKSVLLLLFFFGFFFWYYFFCFCYWKRGSRTGTKRNGMKSESRRNLIPKERERNERSKDAQETRRRMWTVQLLSVNWLFTEHPPPPSTRRLSRFGELIKRDRRSKSLSSYIFC